MTLAFCLESQQLRTGKWHQSLDEFSDARLDRRPPFDGNPTTLCPFVCLPLNQKQRLGGDVLIEARDMFQARRIDLVLDAAIAKFVECLIQEFRLKFSEMSGGAGL